MQHDADRGARARRLRKRLAEPAAGVVPYPVDGDRQLANTVDIERLRTGLAREDFEARVADRARGRRRASVPGRREERLYSSVEALVQKAAPGEDVGELNVRGPRRAELALASDRLVVGVRETVLMHVREAAALVKDRRRRPSHGGRDGSDVDPHAGVAEGVQEEAEPVVAPAGVVGAEEERDGLLGAGERRPQRIEPGGHPTKAGR